MRVKKAKGESYAYRS